MKEELRDLFDAFELQVEWKFIELEEKLENIRVKQIMDNPFLTICEKYNMINKLEE